MPSATDQNLRDSTVRTAELEAELQALREQSGRLRQILDSAIDYAIITLDMDGRITGWNVGAQQTLGYTEAEVLGRSGNIIFTAADRDNDRFGGELRRAIETGRANNERWHLRRDGSQFWASGLMMPLLNPDGIPEGFLSILRDRSDARAESERRELLMVEMNHRIKNTFATVQAVAAQTSRHASTAADFQTAFGARLLALARSHDVLIRGDWADAPLREVIEGALAAFGGEPSRIRLEGPPILLAANQVVTVSLALHELATNAVKYGALSTPAGGVTVTWMGKAAQKGAGRVEIVWRERGGPLVQQPERRGFGSNLLERGMSPGGAVQLDFRPEGLECRISLPPGTGHM